jgi:3-deoxy-manno-octulosonate cytidylyltransferase (CMP-KDO synthetase)
MQPEHFIVVIPARFGSSRLPGKPLADIAGKTLIRRVWEQARKSDAQSVVVATDDERIAEEVTSFGGDYCLTRADHESGTDRLQEVAQQLELADDTVVVNVQGDEPLIPPAVINQVAHNLHRHNTASAATLFEPIAQAADFQDANVVKLVAAEDQTALYFSRAPIPWPRDHFASDNTTLPAGFTARRHIGIYAYRVKLLHEFVTWKSAPLEQIERLEQLRILHNGHGIHVAEACDLVPGGVDTPADLAKVRQLVEQGHDH